MNEYEYILVSNKTALKLASECLRDVLYMAEEKSQQSLLVESQRNIQRLIDDAFARMPELEEYVPQTPEEPQKQGGEIESQGYTSDDYGPRKQGDEG